LRGFILSWLMYFSTHIVAAPVEIMQQKKKLFTWKYNTNSPLFAAFYIHALLPPQQKRAHRPN